MTNATSGRSRPTQSARPRGISRNAARVQELSSNSEVRLPPSWRGPQGSSARSPATFSSYDPHGVVKADGYPLHSGSGAREQLISVAELHGTYFSRHQQLRHHQKLSTNRTASALSVGLLSNTMTGSPRPSRYNGLFKSSCRLPRLKSEDYQWELKKIGSGIDKMTGKSATRWTRRDVLIRSTMGFHRTGYSSQALFSRRTARCDRFTGSRTHTSSNQNDMLSNQGRFRIPNPPPLGNFRSRARSSSSSADRNSDYDGAQGAGPEDFRVTAPSTKKYNIQETQTPRAPWARSKSRPTSGFT